MHNHRIIKLLKTLEEREIINFQNFVCSSYFNKNKQCEKLLRLILSSSPHYDCKKLDKSILNGKLFPQKENLHSFNKTLSSLTKLLVDFFVQEETSQEVIRKKYMLLKVLLKKGLFNEFLKTYKETVTLLNNQIKHSRQYFYEKFLLSQLYHEYSLLTKNRKNIAGFKEVVTRYDQYNFLQKMVLACKALNIGMIIQDEVHLPLIEEINTVAGQTPFDNNMSLQIYRSVFAIFKEDWELETGVELFKITLEKIKKNEAKLPHKELEEIYTFLLNIAMRKLRKGHLSYYREIFDIYSQMEETGIMEKSHITPARIKNVISVCCRINEYDWSCRFFEKYKDRLPEKYKESIHHFRLAAVSFYEAKFEKSLDHLHKTGKIDAYFEMSRKSLLLKCYYELKQNSEFLYIADNSKQYLKKNQSISKKNKTAFSNFVNFLAILLKLKLGFSNRSKEKLILKLNQYEYISDKAWLKDKMEEI